MINQEGTYCPGPNAQTSGNMWAFSNSKYLDGREPPYLFVKSAYCSSLILTLRPYRGTLNKFPKILPYFFHLQFPSHFVCSQVSSRIKGTYSRNLTRLFFLPFPLLLRRTCRTRWVAMTQFLWLLEYFSSDLVRMEAVHHSKLNSARQL